MLNKIFLNLGLLLGILLSFMRMRHKDRVTGKNEQKLENAEETIENVKKANNAESTDDYDDELRDKYGIK